MNMDSKRAVTFGRYSPVTIGHATAAVAIVQRWEHLTTGVLEIVKPRRFAVPAPFRSFYDACDAKCRPTQNPFSSDERIRMWKATIRQLALRERVSVVALQRPEYSPSVFNSLFPPSDYDLVFPSTANDATAFDSKRNVQMARILNRPVFRVEPPIIVHASDIRGAVALGCPWAWFLPSGSLKTFMSMNGEVRIARRTGKANAGVHGRTRR